MGIRDDEAGAGEPALHEATEERGPEGLGLGGADMQAHDLAPPVGVRRDGEYGGDGDDASALADLQVGGVEPQIGPLAIQGPGEEGADALVDVLGTVRDLVRGSFADTPGPAPY
jgi:hypothetical protein